MAAGKETGHGAERLVVFDVEGILIPKNRYLLFETSNANRFPTNVKLLKIKPVYFKIDLSPTTSPLSNGLEFPLSQPMQV